MVEKENIINKLTQYHEQDSETDVELLLKWQLEEPYLIIDHEFELTNVFTQFGKLLMESSQITESNFPNYHSLARLSWGICVVVARFRKSIKVWILLSLPSANSKECMSSRCKLGVNCRTDFNQVNFWVETSALIQKKLVKTKVSWNFDEIFDETRTNIQRVSDAQCWAFFTIFAMYSIVKS